MTSPDAHSRKSLAERASYLSLKYQTENVELKQELFDLYNREKKLLKIIDKRDKQLADIAAGRIVKIPAERKIDDHPMDSQEIAYLKSELEYLQRRYDALQKSKLGRLQLWYWRQKAGK